MPRYPTMQDPMITFVSGAVCPVRGGASALRFLGAGNTAILRYIVYLGRTDWTTAFVAINKVAQIRRSARKIQNKR
mgnify:CR=1 FL=1